MKTEKSIVDYEQEKKKFDEWWDKITEKSENWTILERSAAHDAWMERAGIFKEMLGDLIAKFLSEKSKKYNIDKNKLVIDYQDGDIRLLRYDKSAFQEWRFLEFIQQTKE